eukprot:TRINITY_DN67754_c0_g1_i1.p1 TRINITY_DN67754_c0_g1~~TRINITY_DN67754_c0_g1_i1.p1  ORF type:complete len:189 (+),score=44.73 TRINITY_DN67754_c0_g1_i1:64-630(+)
MAMAILERLIALQCVFVLVTGRSQAVDADGLVALQVDLPPDVQRMFEEMCELEGISQSEMLTRWIDARWEAMGYKDSDLANVEPEQATATSQASSCEATGTCRASSAPETDRGGSSRTATETSSRSANKPATEAVSEPRSAGTESRPQAAARPVKVDNDSDEDEDEEEEQGVPDLDTWMRQRTAEDDD